MDAINSFSSRPVLCDCLTWRGLELIVKGKSEEGFKTKITTLIPGQIGEKSTEKKTDGGYE